MVPACELARISCESQNNSVLLYVEITWHPIR